MKYDEVIRNTYSVCPKCLRKVSAEIVAREGEVFLLKKCPEHGEFFILISKNIRFYKKLNRLYFRLFPNSLLQKDYIVHITNKCNLNCPICLANSNKEDYSDEYSIDKLKNFLENKKNFKIDLMGAEPTMREDLFDIIKFVRESGNIPALHTNGIRLKDYNYLKNLKRAGLEEVHLQFDGFNDESYKAIRGRKLLDIKLKVLENLEKLSVPTDLKVTIVRGVNDNEFEDILNFGINKDFIKEIFFLGCRYLGRARDDSIDNCLVPDELLDMFIKQTKGKIGYEDFLKFHKLYYRILKLFSIRKCFYNRHLLFVRDKNLKKYVPITRLFSLKSYFKAQGLDLFNMNFQIIKNISNTITDNISNLFKNFRLSNLSDQFLLLGFISACDSYIFDYEVAKNCGKGAISSRRGVQPCGALDNINRDCKFQNFEKNEYSSSS